MPNGLDSCPLDGLLHQTTFHDNEKASTHPYIGHAVDDQAVFRSDSNRVDNVTDSWQETARKDPFSDKVNISLIWALALFPTGGEGE